MEWCTWECLNHTEKYCFEMYGDGCCFSLLHNVVWQNMGGPKRTLAMTLLQILEDWKYLILTMKFHAKDGICYGDCH